MNPTLQTLYGLKFHPFHPDVPPEALYVSPPVESFLRRVQASLVDGGFVLITGDPGCGKSVVLRLLSDRLRRLPDVLVGTLEHPQSHTGDFYRELGELFSVPLAIHNRWAGFKALRARWTEHISSSLSRPVLLLDEAQEVLAPVLGELRILCSKQLDSRQLLCVVFAGDQRFPERLRQPDLMPLGSRIRRRLVLDYASPQELLACLDQRLEAAGNPALMTAELKSTLAEHAAGNYRVLMNLADELLSVALEQQRPQLDEKLYLETFTQTQRPKTAGARKR